MINITIHCCLLYKYMLCWLNLLFIVIDRTVIVSGFQGFGGFICEIFLFYSLVCQGPTPNNTPWHLSYYIHTQLLEFSNPLECLFKHPWEFWSPHCLLNYLLVDWLTTNTGPLSDARLEAILNYILDEPSINGFWIIEESSTDPPSAFNY